MVSSSCCSLLIHGEGLGFYSNVNGKPSETFKKVDLNNIFKGQMAYVPKQFGNRFGRQMQVKMDK